MSSLQFSRSPSEISRAVSIQHTDDRAEARLGGWFDTGDGVLQICGQYGIRNKTRNCVWMCGNVGFVDLHRQHCQSLPLQHPQMFVRHAPGVLRAPAGQYCEQRREGELERKDDAADLPFAARTADLDRVGRLLLAVNVLRRKE